MLTPALKEAMKQRREAGERAAWIKKTIIDSGLSVIIYIFFFRWDALFKIIPVLNLSLLYVIELQITKLSKRANIKPG